MNIRTGLSMAGMAALAVGSVLYMNVLGLGLHPSPYTRAASLTISDTNGLTVGSKVLYRGVTIGRIDRLIPNVDGVQVDWKYDSHFPIPTRSRFRIDTLSALGESYLAVLPTTPAGPYLGDHATIPSTEVTVPTTIQELSERLTRLLDQVNPDQVRAIMRELDTALPADGVVLVDLSHAWTLYDKMVTARTENLTTVLQTFQAMLADSVWLPPGLAGSSVDIRKFGVDMGHWLSDSADTAAQAPFPDGISKGTGPFIDDLQKFLDKASPDLKVLGVTTLPAVRAAASTLHTVDISGLLDNAIHNSAGGALTLHVSTPIPAETPRRPKDVNAGTR